MKAVIVDIRGGYAAALAENGEVRRVKNAAYEIGQEIELGEAAAVMKRRTLTGSLRQAGAIAAAAALVIFAGGATAYAIPYGTVSVEVNPTIEYTINCFDYVIGVKAANEEGEAVLEEIEAGNLRHRRIGDAIEATLKQIEKDGSKVVGVHAVL